MPLSDYVDPYEGPVEWPTDTTADLAEKRVTRGAEWLDREVPGWFDHIDTEILDIRDERCILSQLAKNGQIPGADWYLPAYYFWQATADYDPAGEGSEAFGFNLSFPRRQEMLDAIHAAWALAIKHRQEATL